MQLFEVVVGGVILVLLGNFSGWKTLPNVLKPLGVGEPSPCLLDITRLEPDVLGHVVSMMVDKKTHSLAMLHGPELALKELFCLPECLARLTKCSLFKEMVPGPELLELVRVARFMGDRLFYAFVGGGGIVPKSKITIRYVNEVVFLNLLFSTREKCCYFSCLAYSLCMSKEFEMLGYLIEITSDDIVKRAEWGYFCTLDFSFELSAVNTRAALKLYRLRFENEYGNMLVGIFLAGTDETVLKEALSLLELPRGDRLMELLTGMITVASDWKYSKYFSHEKEDINMTLLARLETSVSGDSKSCSLARYVRLLYSIRFGQSQHKLVDDMTTLGLFPKPTGPDSNVRFSILLMTVICAGNRELFAKFLPYVYEEHDLARPRILLHPSIERLLSFDEYKKLFSLREMSSLCRDHEVFKKMVHDCKTMPGFHVIEERFVQTYDVSLVRFAIIGDEAGFEAILRRPIDDKEEVVLKSVLRNVICYADDPVPFVEMILADGYHDAYTHSLGSGKFLRALLLSERGVGVYNLLGEYEIEPDDAFLEALLDDRVMRDAFRGGKGRILKGIIRINLQKFSDRCIKGILELFEILGVTVGNDAYALGTADELDDRLASLRSALTLQTLNAFAQQPGFLACVSLLYDENFFASHQCFNQTFETLNPIRLRALKLLRQWCLYDRRSFVQYADWPVVLAIFSAVPDGELRLKLGDSNEYPEPLERVISRLQDGVILLEFVSERHRAEFEKTVLPVIKEVMDKVGCKLRSRVIVPVVIPWQNLVKKAAWNVFHAVKGWTLRRAPSQVKGLTC